MHTKTNMAQIKKKWLGVKIIKKWCNHHDPRLIVEYRCEMSYFNTPATAMSNLNIQPGGWRIHKGGESNKLFNTL